jgi:flavin reductase (DIM6/NTAB) family NADH-FMN oxidoreductase RutF
MDTAIKKTVLRMIPYGLYVLTAKGADGAVSAATINWVTQASFSPPLLAIGVKADSHVHSLVKQTGVFVLNILGKGQQAMAFTFFKPAVLQDNTISGESFHYGLTGAPIFDSVPAFVECKLVEMVEGKGDHSIIIAEVIDAGLVKQPDNRPDDVTLWLKDLGEKIFYGG